MTTLRVRLENHPQGVAVHCAACAELLVTAASTRAAIWNAVTALDHRCGAPCP